MPKQLTTDQIGQIVMLRMQENTCKAIAKQIGVHESTVYRFLKKYDQDGAVTPTPRPGKQSKISDKDIRNIIFIIKRSRKITVGQLLEEAGLAHVGLATLSRAIKFRILNHRCRHRTFNNAQSLFETLQTAWNTFTDVELTKLVDNMPKRMTAVLKAKGGHTRY